MLWLKQGKREGELVACTLLHHVPWANLEGCDAEQALRTMGPVAQSRCKDEDTEDPEVKWFIDCPTDNNTEASGPFELKWLWEIAIY